MVHPVDEALLGDKAHHPMAMEMDTSRVEEQPRTSNEGVRRVIPTLITKEIKQEQDVKHFKPLAIGTLLDTMLQAMEGAGDEECKIIRIK